MCVIINLLRFGRGSVPELSKCSYCVGRGHLLNEPEVTCKNCEGEGEVRVRYGCNYCDAQGHVKNNPAEECKNCGGRGWCSHAHESVISDSDDSLASIPESPSPERRATLERIRKRTQEHETSLKRERNAANQHERIQEDKASNKRARNAANQRSVRLYKHQERMPEPKTCILKCWLQCRKFEGFNYSASCRALAAFRRRMNDPSTGIVVCDHVGVPEADQASVVRFPGITNEIDQQIVEHAQYFAARLLMATHELNCGISCTYVGLSPKNEKKSFDPLCWEFRWEMQLGNASFSSVVHVESRRLCYRHGRIDLDSIQEECASCYFDECPCNFAREVTVPNDLTTSLDNLEQDMKRTIKELNILLPFNENYDLFYLELFVRYCFKRCLRFLGGLIKLWEHRFLPHVDLRAAK